MSNRILSSVAWLVLSFLPAVSAAQIAPPPEEAEEAPQPPQITALPELKTFVEAPYPEEALAQGIEATVPVQIDIGIDGSVSNPVVTQPAGWGFDAAALEAVSQFVFTPAQSTDGPIAVRIVYEYRFTIKEEVVIVEQDPVLSLRGTVLKKGTRLPLGGIAVEIEGTEIMEVTDKNGRFELFDIPPGEQTLVVLPSQYKEFRKSIEVVEGEVGEVTLRLVEDPFAEFRTIVRAAPTKEVSRGLQTEELRKIPGTGGMP